MPASFPLCWSCCCLESHVRIRERSGLQANLVLHRCMATSPPPLETVMLLEPITSVAMGLELWKTVGIGPDTFAPCMGTFLVLLYIAGSPLPTNSGQQRWAWLCPQPQIVFCNLSSLSSEPCSDSCGTFRNSLGELKVLRPAGTSLESHNKS